MFLKYEQYIFERIQNQKIELSNIEESEDLILKEFKYDNEKKLLEVEFENGSIYQYENIPSEVYDKMVEEGILGKIGQSIWSGAKSIVNGTLFGIGNSIGSKFWNLMKVKSYPYKKIK